MTFVDKKKKKLDFYKNKKVIKICEIEFNKLLVSEEEPYGSENSIKYFIGYNINDIIRQLCIRFPQMIGYVRSFQSNTATSSKISGKQLLRKYNQI